MPHYFRECVCLTEAEETVTFISNILGGGTTGFLCVPLSTVELIL